uniref:DDE Tnp4 domain-containing protein n=1 Tax=Romanomermis culicivorax TaxID=13658 RepID=A0A915KM85_ROMCU
MQPSAPDNLAQFFSAQARIRHIIECSFGVLKNRWQCLKERLRVKDVLLASNLIKVCFVLHNFIIECNADDFDEYESEPDLEENSENEEEDNAPSASAGRQHLEFM